MLARKVFNEWSFPYNNKTYFMLDGLLKSLLLSPHNITSQHLKTGLIIMLILQMRQTQSTED